MKKNKLILEMSIKNKVVMRKGPNETRYDDDGDDLNHHGDEPIETPCRWH